MKDKTEMRVLETVGNSGVGTFCGVSCTVIFNMQ